MWVHYIVKVRVKVSYARHSLISLLFILNFVIREVFLCWYKLYGNLGDKVLSRGEYNIFLVGQCVKHCIGLGWSCPYHVISHHFAANLKLFSREVVLTLQDSYTIQHYNSDQWIRREFLFLLKEIYMFFFSVSNRFHSWFNFAINWFKYYVQ